MQGTYHLVRKHNTKLKKLIHIVFIFSLVLGIGGRLYGSYVNTESNDDHVEVVLRILDHQSIAKDSCWECFQPPLFYQMNAKVANLLGNQGRSSITRQLQFENTVFTLLSLYFLFLLLKHQRIKPDITKLSLSFWLVNPALFGMSFQATNDIVIVFLASAATYYLVRYISLRQVHYMIYVLLLLGLAPHIKGSGIALFGILGLLSIIIILVLKKHRYLLILVGGISYLLLFQSHYTENARIYDNPFVINQPKLGKPPLFDDGQEFWKRPGITSVWSGYFKLQSKSLIDTPYNINSGDIYPKHRTSFWAQIYGSFYFSQFLAHPITWVTHHPDVLNVVRVTFVIGLLPILFILWGGFQTLRDMLTKTLRKQYKNENWNQLIHLCMAGGFLFFTLKYSYDYRDFGCIKAIFILPAFLSLNHFLTVFLTHLDRKKLARFTTTRVIVVVILCSATNIFLLKQLTTFYFTQ